MDAVIEQLRTDGVAEAGKFTIDTAEAHRRMAEFGLPDQGLYVLDLVQLAVCKGASKLEIRSDKRSLHLSFDGAPITTQDAELAHSTLFFRSNDDDPEERARARLAFALGTVTVRGARLRLTSGDGKHGVRLVVDGGPERIEEATDAEAGTTLEIVYTSSSPAHELTLLRERARYAPMPLLLDGERLDGGFELQDVFAKSPCTTEGTRCQLGFEIRRTGGRMLLVADGVVLAEHPLDNTRDGFVALVEASALRRDLSQWELIRDDRYDALVTEVRQMLRDWTGPSDLEQLRAEAHDAWIARTLEPWVAAFASHLNSRMRILHGLSALPAVVLGALLLFLFLGVLNFPIDSMEGIGIGVLIAMGAVFWLMKQILKGFIPGPWLDEQVQSLPRIFDRPGELARVTKHLEAREAPHDKARNTLLRRLESS